MQRPFIILLLLVAGRILPAQLPPLPHAINYNVEDGLPSSEVYCVMEDSRGYMWFGTDNGVARYDGYAFRAYEEADGLENLVIFSIKEGPDGKIYACDGKSALVFVWEENTDRFTPFPGNAALRKEALRINNNHTKLKGVLPGERLLINLSTAGPVIVSGDGGIETRYTPGLFSFAAILENPTIEPTGASFNTVADRRQEKQFRLRGGLTLCLKDPLGRILHKQRFTSKNWIGNFIPFVFTTVSESRDTTVILTKEGLARVWPLNNPAAAKEYAVQEKNLILFKYALRSKGFILGFNSGEGLRYFPTLGAYLSGGGQTLIVNCNASYAAEDRYGGLWVTTTDRGIYYFPNPAIGVYDQRQGYPAAKAITVTTIGADEVGIGYENSSVLVATKKPGDLQSITQKYTTTFKPLTLFFDPFSNKLFTTTSHINLKDKVLERNGAYLTSKAGLVYTGGGNDLQISILQGHDITDGRFRWAGAF